MVPFQEVLLPLVKSAKESLLASVPKGLILNDRAVTASESSLLQSLSQICGQSLILEFWMQNQNYEIPILIDSTARPTERYEKFVKSFQDKKFEQIFMRYPELGRLVQLTIDQWIETNIELLMRLYRDRLRIQKLLGFSEDIGDVLEISFGFSDRHRGGRTVARIRFSSDKYIWYKPKDIEIDFAYSKFVDWCNREFDWRLKVIKVLPCEGYGWMEDVQPEPCLCKEDTWKFFENAGLLLAMIYILRGSDLHSENVIACGNNPVIVDLEMLLQPEINQKVWQRRNNTDDFNSEKFSVRSIGYLPSRKGNGEFVFDISGLGAKGNDTTPARGIRWINVNTDHMNLEFIDAQLETGNHLPDFLGLRLEPINFGEDIVRGFRKGYCAFMSKRERVLCEAGPLENFNKKKIRYLLRSSVAYGSVLRTTYNPKYLTSKIERRKRLKSLVSVDVGKTSDSETMILANAELEALEQNDIPIFNVCSTEVDITTSRGTIRDFFIEPALESVRKGLNELSEADMQKQISLIIESLSV